MDRAIELATQIDNPYALVGFVVAILFFLVSRSQSIRRSAFLSRSLVALSIAVVAGSLAIAWRDANSRPDPKQGPRNQVAESKSQSSEGMNSPNVSDVQGDVTITIEQQRAPDAPAFRVTYYRMGGLAAYFLVHGLLAPEWQGILGEHQNIVRNSVFEEANRFLSEFAEPVFGDVFFGEFPLQDEFLPNSKGNLYQYAKNLAPNSVGRDQQNFPNINESVWRSYLGGTGHFNLFVPDVNAATTVFSSLDWPRDYNFYYPAWRSYAGDWTNVRETAGRRIDEDSLIEPPVIWRYLTVEDLDHYPDRYVHFTRLIGERHFSRLAWTGRYASHDIAEGRQLNFSYVDSIRYLSRNGLPPNFMLVTGHAAPHGGWTFSASVRDLEIVIAVFENLGPRPVRVGSAVVKEIAQNTLRLPERTRELLQHSQRTEFLLYAPEILEPREKIIVPIRMQLGDDRGWRADDTREYKGQRGETVRFLLNKLANRGQSVIRVGSTGHLLFQKRAGSFRQEQSPEYPERFDYGPSWAVESINLDGKPQNVRSFDETNFLLYAGFEKGSCPVVFTFQPDTGLWFNEGEVLVKASSPAKRRSEYITLERFQGTVAIREIEDEIAFIDEVALVVGEYKGSSQRFRSEESELKRTDDVGVVLRKGDSLTLQFPVTERDWASENVRLFLSGFYVPMSAGVPLAAYAIE